MIYGANPKSILENPAAELIKSIPSTWDETLVLPGSEVGEMAGFARRKGSTWFVGILNGSNTRKIKLSLTFLDPGNYSASLVRDKIDEAGAEILDKGIADRGDLIEIEMRSGGGFVARYTPIGAKSS